MDISHLHIFQKDTDATAPLRGYQYQVLKTLETWISNLLEDNQEEIYCEFEEDIFQKSEVERKVKFRQIKLYSSNFSFHSDEIKKCLVKFFLLHLKSDHRNYKKQFVFETNSKIASKYKGNDANLLRTWVKNQENLSGKLLKDCIDKVKSIVSEHFNSKAELLAKSLGEESVNKALLAFSELTNDDWKEFVKLIGWQFASVPPEEEFVYTRNRIKGLLLRVPFPVNEKNVDAVYGILFKEVSLRSSEEKPVNRKLTHENLLLHLISAGTEEDKWYAEVFDKYSVALKKEFIRIGEIIEILDASRYCRKSQCLIEEHHQFWLKVLDDLIINEELSLKLRRSAIYEYIWLKIHLVDIFEEPTGDLLGCESIIRHYFSRFENFLTAMDLEEGLTILKIIDASHRKKKINITENELNLWYQEISSSIKSKLATSINPNEQCQLFELLASFFLLEDQKLQRKKPLRRYFEHLEKILKIVEKADFYNVTALSHRINYFIKFFIKKSPVSHAHVIQSLESFLEKIDEIIGERDGDYRKASIQIERGLEYANSKNPKLLLKALSYFHSAKDLLFQSEAIDRYVLVLVTISQLYNSIRMNLAAKYYALAGAWVCNNSDDKNLLTRIADSMEMVFQSDYRQGAWMSAILDFNFYLMALQEFNSEPIDFGNNKIPTNTIIPYSLLLHITPTISPQFEVLIKSQIDNLGYLYEDVFSPALDVIKKEHPTINSIDKLIESAHDDLPLNDVGETRTIRFNALGSQWAIVFPNDYVTNSIAEEFCAMLQIALCEIALSEVDLHLMKGKINLELEIADKYLPAEQLPSIDEFKWKYFVYHFDNSDPIEIDKHMTHSFASLLLILNEISLLKFPKFRELFEKMFKRNEIARNTFSANVYQRMYRLIFSQTDFDSQQRLHFLPVQINAKISNQNEIMSWRKNVSEKYNKEESIEHIKERFKNSKKCIHVTLSELTQKKEFSDLINRLRSAGYLDWQIVLGMTNFVINYKARQQLSSKSFGSEEEYTRVLSKTFLDLFEKDEKECYVRFPIEAFESQEFRLNLDKYPVTILNTYNLHNKSRFPNLPAIKEFLDVRFNMRNDSTDEYNPLKDIPYMA